MLNDDYAVLRVGEQIDAPAIGLLAIDHYWVAQTPVKLGKASSICHPPGDVDRAARRSHVYEVLGGSAGKPVDYRCADTLARAATKTENGEGSFDKGFYLSIPFDELLNTSTMRRANVVWPPLTRDGGAEVNHTYSLRTMTESRDSHLLYEDFERITE